MLIDADNVSAKYVKTVLDEISVYGTATYKRMYGDWTANGKNSWKEIALEYSINPIQQYSYTTGKNSSDSALIIDAMDILYSGRVGGFCLVSSDSDFTKLAQRLREEGMLVIGMGESKTPKPFRTACDAFKILDVIAQDVDISASPSGGKRSGKTNQAEEITSREEIVDAIHTIITENSNSGRATDMGTLGSLLSKKFSDFDVRNYGYSKLITFLESFGEFEIIKVQNGYKISDKNTAVSREAIDDFISGLITANGGLIDNLSLVNEELKKKFPSFSAKQYGFARFSSFLNSSERFGVVGNSVRMKKSLK